MIKRDVITPGARTNLHVRRTGKRKGRISFQAAPAKGSAITGYDISCEPRSRHHSLVTARGTHSPLTVSGLARGVARRCTVETSSRAGMGPAAAAKLPR